VYDADREAGHHPAGVGRCVNANKLQYSSSLSDQCNWRAWFNTKTGAGGPGEAVDDGKRRYGSRTGDTAAREAR
jgi:hypothetical protein